jgi:putative flippase GtrA
MNFRRITRFLLVGGTATFITWALIFFLNDVLLLFYIPAVIFAEIVGYTYNFFMNKFFTFKQHSKNYKRQASIFTGVSIGGILLNIVIIIFIVENFEIKAHIAKLISAIFVAFYSYGLHSKFTFKK